MVGGKWCAEFRLHAGGASRRLTRKLPVFVAVNKVTWLEPLQRARIAASASPYFCDLTNIQPRFVYKILLAPTTSLVERKQVLSFVVG